MTVAGGWFKSFVKNRQPKNVSQRTDYQRIPVTENPLFALMAFVKYQPNSRFGTKTGLSANQQLKLHIFEF